MYSLENSVRLSVRQFQMPLEGFVLCKRWQHLELLTHGYTYTKYC